MGELASSIKESAAPAGLRRSEIGSRQNRSRDQDSGSTHVGGGHSPALIGRSSDHQKPSPAAAIRRKNGGAPSPAREVLVHPASYASEQYRQLALKIFETLEATSRKSVLVTSATRGEGKSTTACNLALATSGLFPKTAIALVELDLRGPVVAENLGFHVEHGVGGVLAGEVTLEKIVVSTNRGNLDILPAKCESQRTHVLFAGTALAVLWREILDRYDLVIVDGPPSLGFSDTSLLVRLADSCVVVARPGVTRTQALRAMVTQLPSEKVLGVVTNDSNAGRHARSSYSQYYDGGPARASFEVNS